MIQWVYEQARASRAAEVIIATDDERIVQACSQFGARVELTQESHQSGTDRIAELAEKFEWSDDHIVVNVQGDEPLIPSALVTQVGDLLEADAGAALATLVVPITSNDEWEDSNIVKVVLDCNSRALYFSRAPIPWSPELVRRCWSKDDRTSIGLRHIGIYAYHVWALKKLASEPPCPAEIEEGLEQLRALWLGFPIRVAVASEDSPRGVDTMQDLQSVRQQLSGYSVGTSE
jgi:3-deoxy-manno-octulosonate cytidylyltransferase (CMP-KDO synthetase)